MKLTKYEMETIITYNQAEPIAHIYTCDKALINRLDKAIENGKEITIGKRTNYSAEYNIPRKCIKVNFPRVLSDEKRAELKLRMMSIQQARKEHENDGK